MTVSLLSKSFIISMDKMSIQTIRPLCTVGRGESLKLSYFHHRCILLKASLQLFCLRAHTLHTTLPDPSTFCHVACIEERRSCTKKERRGKGRSGERRKREGRKRKRGGAGTEAVISQLMEWGGEATFRLTLSAVSPMVRTNRLSIYLKTRRTPLPSSG